MRSVVATSEPTPFPSFLWLLMKIVVLYHERSCNSVLLRKIDSMLFFCLIHNFVYLTNNDDSLAANWSAIFRISVTLSPLTLTNSFSRCTVVQNNQEYRLEYWANCSSFRSFACTAHSFAPSLTLLTPKLVGQWLIRWSFILCFFSILAHSGCRYRMNRSHHVFVIVNSS